MGESDLNGGDLRGNVPGSEWGRKTEHSGRRKRDRGCIRSGHYSRCNVRALHGYAPGCGAVLGEERTEGKQKTKKVPGAVRCCRPGEFTQKGTNGTEVGLLKNQVI
jgi:hypothetical protein